MMLFSLAEYCLPDGVLQQFIIPCLQHTVQIDFLIGVQAWFKLAVRRQPDFIEELQNILLMGLINPIFPWDSG
jgi:hypothetical protein